MARDPSSDKTSPKSLAKRNSNGDRASRVPLFVGSRQNTERGIILNGDKIVVRIDEATLEHVLAEKLADFGFTKEKTQDTKGYQWARQNDAAGRVLANELLRLIQNFAVSR
jgi:hypothetical protein